VKLLIDANLSPAVARRLVATDHDAVHVFDVALGTATDDEILRAAATDGRVIVSSDSDFGALLARHGHRHPSFVLLRHGNELTAAAQADLLVAAIAAAADELEAGAVISVSPGHLRTRRLPFGT